LTLLYGFRLFLAFMRYFLSYLRLTQVYK
jgi:hypothetical protein